MNLEINKNQVSLVADNGKKLSIVPSFDKDLNALCFLDGSDVIKIIKKQSKSTFKSKKDNKEKHYYNFYIILSNRKSFQIKCKNVDDLRTLDALSEYVK